MYYLVSSCNDNIVYENLLEYTQIRLYHDD